jgi:hypothetical protein
MSALHEDMERLREAWLDLFYELTKPLVPLFRKLGVTEFKPWVRERQAREQWRK